MNPQHADGTLEKSRMLVKLHPDVCRMTKKFNRWHYHVDYSSFKNRRLVPVDDLAVGDGSEYQMRVVDCGSGMTFADDWRTRKGGTE